MTDLMNTPIPIWSLLLGGAIGLFIGLLLFPETREGLKYLLNCLSRRRR